MPRRVRYHRRPRPLFGDDTAIQLSRSARAMGGHFFELGDYVRPRQRLVDVRVEFVDDCRMHAFFGSCGSVGRPAQPHSVYATLTPPLVRSFHSLNQSLRSAGHRRSIRNWPKNAVSSACAFNGSTFDTYWSGRTTTIAPVARSMLRRSKMSTPFLRSGQ